MKKVVFLGTDGIGAAALRWLWERQGSTFELVGAVSGVDRKMGRGLHRQANPIAALSKNLKLDVLQTERPAEELVPWLEERMADLGIVFAYGHILRQRALDTPPMGFVNLHASQLPELRGPSPIEGAILGRRDKTGMTLMRLVREMDAGPIFGTVAVAIERDETTPSLRKKMSIAAVEVLERFWEKLLAGQLPAVAQDASMATHTHILRREDGFLNFSRPAEELEAMVRAHIAWPGSYFFLKGERILVRKAAIGQGTAAHGSLLGLRHGALEIAAGNGVLRCLELQRPARKTLPADVIWRQLLCEWDTVPSHVDQP
ncbi:MAG: methionyl-tRNA formyltransferase [Puniceicoccales bacterium]|nr:methionyl-tRNA formyltransferase [Puniceicoccales bacterium]